MVATLPFGLGIATPFTCVFIGRRRDEAVDGDDEDEAEW